MTVGDATSTTGATTAHDPGPARDRADVALESATGQATRALVGPVLARTGHLAEADIAALLEHWAEQRLGSPMSDRRYHWEIGPSTWDLSPVPAAAMWRPREGEWFDREPVAFASRLTLPIAIAETTDLLLGLAARDGPVSTIAERLLADSLPLAEDDVARFIVGHDVWRDTFALWILSASDRARDQFAPLLTALAARYGSRARRDGGVVTGRHFPFHEEPLVSASAHLGTSLTLLGLYPSLIPSLAEFVGARQAEDGGFADPGQPTDVLTSLAAADFLSRLEPSFEPSMTAEFLAARQGSDGFWRALGPEAVWLTAGVARWLDLSRLPFWHRFRWPDVPRWFRDRKTGLPPYRHFSDLGRMFSAVPSLASSHVEVAFLDLAAFGAFNNAAGQQAGDQLLRLLATALEAIPGVRAIRDGGDEFLLVGAPTRRGLAADVAGLQRSWVAARSSTFGEDAQGVVARAVVATGPGRDLVALRERLGREIGSMKHLEPGPTGLLREV